MFCLNLFVKREQNMPLPVGHSLMGYALSDVMKVRLAKKTWRNVFIFAVLANLPDIDFLPGFLLGRPNSFHHSFVHSLGFALFIGLAGGLIYYWRQRRKPAPLAGQEGATPGFWPYFVAISVAVFSHCILDMFTVDTSPLYGMPVFWPFDTGYYDVDVRWDVFASINKSDDSATFFQSLLQWHNFKVALQEFLIMGTLVGLVKLIKRWRPSPSRKPAVDIGRTQVAKLGLLEVSPLRPELARRRSLTSLIEAAEQDESEK
jgi:membrane-bound metal-dependent hydrolase YbcI (DUF457 family)